MDLGNPIMTTLVGLIVFYIGLKMFSGGMKSMGNLEHLNFFIHNPYWMFVGGIVMTLLWQSSSLSTTAIIALVASGAVPLPAAIAAVLGANIGTTGTIWLAGLLVSDGVPKGDMVSPQIQELYMLVEYLAESTEKLKEQMESEIPLILKNEMVIQFHEERLIDLEERKNGNH